MSTSTAQTDNQTTAAVNTLDFDAFEADRASDPNRFESAFSTSQTALNYEELYLAQRAENEKLAALLEVTRSANASPVSQADARPLTTFAQLHGRIGWAGINRLSPAEKAAAVGLDAVPTDDEVLRYFKSGASQDAGLLMRTDPKRYRRLREYGRLTRIL